MTEPHVRKSTVTDPAAVVTMAVRFGPVPFAASAQAGKSGPGGLARRGASGAVRPAGPGLA
ncbi:hypothetical protein [Streptomyces sp. NPDC046860]|uniref:hypothetical protein n=1 Tax=Streptomyces sp. NPDC046860 TaxID=3154495 RepID=UPI00340B3099